MLIELRNDHIRATLSHSPMHKRLFYFFRLRLKVMGSGTHLESEIRAGIGQSAVCLV